jgi:hypothetical protein
MAQTWSRVNGNIVLSNGNLTASLSGVTNYCPGFGGTGASSGKYYWETTVSGTGVAGITLGLGLGNTSSAVTTGNWLGFVTDTLGFFSNGLIWNNNATVTGTMASFVSGDVICHALNLDSGSYWARIGTTGSWNNTGTADPVAGTGALAIPAGVLANPVVPAFNLHDPSSDTVVAAFASASWAGVAPTGFGSFDALGDGTILMGQICM